MRITGGQWRSRRLVGPSRNMPLRPTPDALRERAFAILGERLPNARFLDLFAGTGAVGIEALSRGAATAVFVDDHPAATRLIRRNLAQLDDAESRSRVVTRPAARALQALARRGERFDLVWADPPFDRWHLGLEALAAVAAGGLIDATGLMMLEYPERSDFDRFPPALEVRRQISCGASSLVMLGVVDAGSGF